MNREIHIACSTDDNYAPLCGVMVCSLLDNNQGKPMHVHVLANHLSVNNRQRLARQCVAYGALYTFHEVDESRLEGCQYRTTVHPLSSAAYYRILLASILHDVSRVIYLDCDMMVMGDLQVVYDMDLKGHGVAAVQDYDTPVDMEHYRQLGLSEGDKYFNSGFMVIDLDFWRQHNTERKLLEFAKLERMRLTACSVATGGVCRPSGTTSTWRKSVSLISLRARRRPGVSSVRPRWCTSPDDISNPGWTRLASPTAASGFTTFSFPNGRICLYGGTSGNGTR